VPGEQPGIQGIGKRGLIELLLMDRTGKDRKPSECAGSKSSCYYLSSAPSVATMRVVRPLKLAVADRRMLDELLQYWGELDEAITPVLKRRIEIVVLAARGLRNKDIALKIGVEPSVVAHWREVFGKRYGKGPFPAQSLNALRPYFADLPRSGRPKK
jgi:hypothetical protein